MAESLPPGDAAFPPLTPTAYLDRSAYVFADRIAVVDGAERWTYAQFADRCLRQSGLLLDLGLEPGDRVAVLAPNTHLMLESHYGVLYAGMVLVALNTRLAADELRFIVEHAGCKALLADPSLRDLAIAVAGDGVQVLGGEEYEAKLAAATPQRGSPVGETELLALNYTSGTTARSKGVMYHGRGAYLQALAMTSHFALNSDTRFLWTLPMFHCNGWTFTWAVTAAGGTHICLPAVEPGRIWQLLDSEAITHLCGAPTVVTSIVHHAAAQPVAGRRITVAVGGAPPSPSLLARCAELGFDITHLYGLTETFGPIAICDWRSEWDQLPLAEQSVLRARQGVGNLVSVQARVVDSAGRDVPCDGVTVGEIALRGNNLMLGYYRDRDATASAVRDRWFMTGDLAVLHPGGYLEIRDRSKDVIISGGENISSVEVEAALASHPAVLEAAVVAEPHAKWGERPVAWVSLKKGSRASSEQLRAHVRARLAAFKVPDRVEFGPLPKTASGKVRKVELRERAAWARDRAAEIDGQTDA